MQINSIQDITTRFKLRSNQQSNIIEELKVLRVDLHPDKNGGEFENEDHKKDYYDLEDALNWLEKNNTLVPLSQLTDLVKVIKDLEKPTEKDVITQLETDLSTKLDKAKSSFSKSFQFPKIAVSTLTGVVSFIWLFPKQLSDHPILGDYAGSFFFNQLWLILFVSTIYLWVFNYIIELKQTNFNKKIESNSFQMDVFKTFLKDRLIKASDRYASDGFLVFSKAQLINYLSKVLQQKKIKRLLEVILVFYTAGLTLAKPRIDVENLEKLGDLILKKNLSKGTLQIYDSRSIDDLYKTNIDERELNSLIND